MCSKGFLGGIVTGALLDDRVGSLEAGKDADVVIYSGNPMEIFTEVRCTIINGKIVYRKEGF